MTNGECRKAYGQRWIYDFDTICAYSGQRGTGICHGDSGGPLAYNNTLIGITSWGALCAKGKPDGFTRISTYVDWIEANMNVEI